MINIEFQLTKMSINSPRFLLYSLWVINEYHNGNILRTFLFLSCKRFIDLSEICRFFIACNEESKQFIFCLSLKSKVPLFSVIFFTKGKIQRFNVAQQTRQTRRVFALTIRLDTATSMLDYPHRIWVARKKTNRQSDRSI